MCCTSKKPKGDKEIVATRFSLSVCGKKKRKIEEETRDFSLVKVIAVFRAREKLIYLFFSRSVEKNFRERVSWYLISISEESLLRIVRVRERQ